MVPTVLTSADRGMQLVFIRNAVASHWSLSSSVVCAVVVLGQGIPPKSMEIVAAGWPDAHAFIMRCISLQPTSMDAAGTTFGFDGVYTTRSCADVPRRGRKCCRTVFGLSGSSCLSSFHWDPLLLLYCVRAGSVLSCRQARV